MDSGNILVSKLSKIKRFLYMYGFFSNFSQGTINDWTFSKTLAYMGVSKQILNRRNLNGACIGFSYSNQTSMELLKKWVECALIKECIAPKGSNRSNHRQDQAVLSVLAYQLNIVDELQKYIDLEKYYGFKIHQDVN
jgi:hypothetical protein